MRTRSLITGLALTGALAGCEETTLLPDGPEPDGPRALRRMASCDDLESRLVDVITEGLVQNRYGYRGGVVEDGMPEDVGTGAPQEGSDGAGGDDRGGDEGPSDFTGTNVQEEGVDEVDLVKTDGRHLFVAQDRALQIVKAWPVDDAERIATVELDGWATGLFLAGDKAVVFQQVQGAGVGRSEKDPGVDVEAPDEGGGSSPGSSGEDVPDAADTDAWGDEEPETDAGEDGSDGGTVEPGGGTVPDDGAAFSGTRLTIVDVSDPAHPVVEHTIDVEGWLADARMVDGEVYAVVNQPMELPQEAWNLLWSDEATATLPQPDWDAPDAEWEAAEAQARSWLTPRVQALVGGLDLGELLPSWRPALDAEPEAMFACEDLYAPSVATPLSMLAVTHVDPQTGELDATGLLSDGWTIYASRDNLYVAQSSQWWWGWDGADVSQLHAFALRGDGEPEYVASGAVEGWVYDQFAMSEHDGHLRVVTTDFTSWWARGEEAPDEPANHVTVLKDDGEGELALVGHVGGIAPGERIMSARLMGEKGYVVTFRQVDPLFTLDLSDPADPRVVGELVMPGYSAYLHPVDDGHLLAVGVTGNDRGIDGGLAVTLFDVTDPAQPEIDDQLEVGGGGDGWAWSEALWDHHAFTYGRGVLTIPATLERYDAQDGTFEGFSGTVSVRAEVGEPVEELGRVDHADLVGDSQCLWDRWYGWEGSCGWEYGYWYAQVRRSVYLEDELVTISDYGVKINALTDPGIEKARVVFYPQ